MSKQETINIDIFSIDEKISMVKELNENLKKGLTVDEFSKNKNYSRKSVGRALKLVKAVYNKRTKLYEFRELEEVQEIPETKENKQEIKEIKQVKAEETKEDIKRIELKNKELEELIKQLGEQVRELKETKSEEKQTSDKDKFVIDILKLESDEIKIRNVRMYSKTFDSISKMCKKYKINQVQVFELAFTTMLEKYNFDR